MSELAVLEKEITSAILAAPDERALEAVRVGAARCRRRSARPPGRR
jgi:hypothetical protein